MTPKSYEEITAEIARLEERIRILKDLRSEDQERFNDSWNEYIASHKDLVTRVLNLEKFESVRKGKEVMSGLILPAVVSVIASGIVAWIITLFQHVSK